MSIAVSAVVKPSRLLFALGAGACLGVAFIGIIFAVSEIGNRSALLRLLIAGSCIFLALSGFYRIAKCRRTHHIDISGTGLIRLREKLLGRLSTDLGGKLGVESSEVLSLMPNSTLWPRLLLLRLQTGEGRIFTLQILPDCVSADDFRALSVAVRWIDGRNNPTTSKIL